MKKKYLCRSLYISHLYKLNVTQNNIRSHHTMHGIQIVACIHTLVYDLVRMFLACSAVITPRVFYRNCFHLFAYTELCVCIFIHTCKLRFG